MSEMDDKEEDILEDVIEEGSEEESGDGSGESEDEVTLEDYKKTKAELERAKKKIAVLSKLSKKDKASEKDSEPKKEVTEDDLDAILEKRDFYKSNADAKEYKEEIETLYSASNGKFSRSELYAKLSGDSEIEENRKVYGKPAVSGKQSQNDSFSALTLSQYDKLTPSAQKEYNSTSKAKFGGVKFKE